MCNGSLAKTEQKTQGVMPYVPQSYVIMNKISEG